jgi:chromosome segregation ATPase
LSSAAPPPESEEWKALQNSVAALREENEKFRTENREMVLKMETAEATREALRHQVSSLKEANATQQGEIESLRAELIETKDTYGQLVVDTNVEEAIRQTQVSDLEVCRDLLIESIGCNMLICGLFE